MTDTKKVALVTGANKGIGLAIAGQLADQGYTVWLGARDHERGQQAAASIASRGDVRFVALDVTDESSVAAAAATVREASGKLDLLINNAGIFLQGVDGAPSTVEIDALRQTYEVNVFGPLRVTRAFLPLLQAASAARVLMVGSGLGSLGLVGDPTNWLSRVSAIAYNSSKTALNALTVGLANELREQGISVFVVNPGYVATDLNNNSGTLTTDQGASAVLDALTVSPERTGAFLDAGAAPLPW